MGYSIKSELGYLCDGKGNYTDKYGNKTNRLKYWSDFKERQEQINSNIIKVFVIWWSIKIFASDIKDVKIIKYRIDKKTKGAKA